jgi:hypothetical protein
MEFLDQLERKWQVVNCKVHPPPSFQHSVVQ